MYAVIDLYGQCAQVSIVHPHLVGRTDGDFGISNTGMAGIGITNSANSSQFIESTHLSGGIVPEIVHRFKSGKGNSSV